MTISPGHGVLRLPGSAREKVDEMIGHCQRQGKESRFKAGELFIAAGLDIDWCNVQQVYLLFIVTRAFHVEMHVHM